MASLAASLCLSRATFTFPAVATAARSPLPLPTRENASGTPRQPAIDAKLGDFPSLRSQRSRTFPGTKGFRTVHVYTTPVNYRDPSGAWQPIDDTFASSTAAGYAYATRADAYRTQLPTDLGSTPVTVSGGGIEVAMKLRGAHGAPSASGASATYGAAMTGVSVRYVSSSNGLSEFLTLFGPKAPTSFVYDLAVSGGTATPAGTGIDIVDPRGRSTMRILPPVVSDAAGRQSTSAVSLALGSSASGKTITVAVEAGWLSAPGRVWPVVVDPDLFITALLSTTCQLDQGYANGNECGSAYGGVGQNTVSVGWDGITALRTLLYFDVQSAVPPQSDVVSANVDLTMQGASQFSASPVSLYQLTRAYTSSATWNTYDATHSWTSAEAILQPPRHTQTTMSPPRPGRTSCFNGRP